MASCCTTPSTGAVRLCRLVRCFGLDDVLAEPSQLLLGLERSSNRPRSYSATVLSRVSARAAIADSVSLSRLFLNEDLLLLAEQVLQLVR